MVGSPPYMGAIVNDSRSQAREAKCFMGDDNPSIDVQTLKTRMINMALRDGLINS